MRFVVHMGPHKTGTSYMQMRLFQGRGELENRGWVYPDIGTYGMEAQHDVAHNPALFMEPEGEYAKDFRDIIQRCHDEDKNLLLSAEGFRTWDAEKMLRLTDLVGAEKAELVFAFRCPFSVFYSYWAEEVKQGFSGSLAFRFMQNFIDWENSQILNPFFDLKRFEDNDRFDINVIYFDAARKHKIDICDLLTDGIMGCGVLPPPARETVNEGFPIELTEFLRLITFRHTKTKRFTNSRYRLAFMQHTTPEERAEIVQTVKTKAGDAFRVFQLPRDNMFYNELKQRFAARPYTRKLPEGGEQDLPDTVLKWRFGDLGMMGEVPEIMALVEKYEERLKEAGF